MSTQPAGAEALRIGAAAAAAGVSPRTLRYYEQRGLLTPAARSAGGERRYDDDDVARVRRIRELVEILGSDLDEVQGVLAAEDRLAELRSASRAARSDPARRMAILAEAERINDALAARVRGRIGRLETLLEELAARRARYERLGEELRAAASAGSS